MQRDWRVAWITGASSGIGRALALELARKGVAIAASARREGELAALASEVSGITPVPVDVTDAAAMQQAGTEIERRLGPIDLAVFNAGIGQRVGLADFDAAKAAETMAVNYQGLVNGLAAVLPAMRERRRGHVALMSSLAGYRGLPRGIDYCPSKAAAISLAESLRHEMVPAGLRISLINPGFIETPMVSNARHPMPYLMPVDEAARRIVAGLGKGRFEIAFPWQMVWLAKLGRILPYRLYFYMAGDRGL
jgi:NAD(P)-dependent dehydrogenase (short-subunit alcohol dehydrogenase family)